jgi:[histone H3]-lysine36 N-dimethyltransferase SETMAR
MSLPKIEWRSVLKFLKLQGKNSSQSHAELKKAYGKETPHRSTIARWWGRLDGDSNEIVDRSRPGRPKTATSTRNVDKVRSVVENDSRLSIQNISRKVKVSMSGVYAILTKILGLSLICARWILKLLTVAQKKTRKSACEENLFLHSLDKDFFLGQIVTGDETYIHYSEPTTKRETSQWLPKGSRPPLKAITKVTAKKVMALVFWDRLGVLLIRYFRKGTTLTGAVYAKILEKLKNAILKKRGEKWEDGVFLLHDNASSHTSRVCQTAIHDLGFIQLTHPPYSPDLAPSDYFLFSK